MDSYYSNNEFDVGEFNKAFESAQKIKIDEENDEELDLLSQEIEKEQLHNMTFGNIFINMKEEVFGTIYDLLSFNYDSSILEIFSKNNRLFYLGIFLILLCFVLYIISYLFFYPKPKDKNFNLNANIGLPKDYKLSYYPYKQQDAKEIIESRQTIANLKKKLVDSRVKIKGLESQIASKPSVPITPVVDTNQDIEYEVDDEVLNSDMIPEIVKEQMKNQVLNE